MTVDRARPMDSAYSSTPSQCSDLWVEVFTHTFGAHLAALPPEAGHGLVDIDEKTSGYPHVHS